jgi:hypothetical protein
MLHGGESLAESDYPELLPEPTADEFDEAYLWLWNPYEPARVRKELHDDFMALRLRWFEAVGLHDYWRAHEFPRQCRPVGRDGFQCD